MNQSLSPLTTKIDALIDAVNRRDPETRRTFLDQAVSKRGLERISMEKYLSLLSTVFSQTGGISLVRSQSLDGVVEAVVKSVKHDHSAKVYMIRDKMDNEGRLLEFGFLPLPDPSESPWPGRVDDLSEVVDEIERHATHLAKMDAFSGVVLVARHETVVFESAYGLADKSSGAANTINTRFNLGSMNKMFTGLAIAQLVESQRLSFQSNLGDVLPRYPNREAASKITVHQLLTHSAGLGGFFDRPSYDRRKKYSGSSDLLQLFAREPLLFEPGTSSAYSNEGYLVLGAIIEEVSGLDYLDYVRENVFRPSDMYDTDSYARNDSTSNRAIGYLRSEDDPFGIMPRSPNSMYLGWRGNACGGGYSTAHDMLNFAITLTRHKLLTKEYTDILIRDQGGLHGYGYGFRVEMLNGKKVIGHSGGGPNSGVNSDMRLFWDNGLSIIVLGNYDAPIAQELNEKISRFLAVQK